MEILNSDRQGWLSRGKILAKLGKHQEAFLCYEKAMEIKPNYYRFWDTTNLLQELLQCLELAESDFDKAIDKYKGKVAAVEDSQPVSIPGKNMASSCYNWACWQALQGNTEKSIAYLEQAIELEGDKYRQISQEDPDLDSIRDRAYFQNIVG